MIKIIKKLLFITFVLSSHSSFSHTINFFQGTPLEIIEIGHPALRLSAKEVLLEEIATETFQTFLDDMIETMSISGGVGLAAPQVNVSKRIFIMKSGRSAPLTIVINPKVKYLSKYGKKKSIEGCLSIPGRRVRVNRFRRIEIKYLNRYGENISEIARGFKAVIAQHEFDHLNGILIIDFYNPLAIFVTPSNYVEVPLM